MFPAPVNKCLQEHCEGQSRFLLQWILAVPKMRDILAARLLRQLILHLLWQCPWNISYDISCVCVYRRNFSAICCLSLEYDHLRAYTSRKGECHNNNADDWKPPLDARKNGETPSRHSSAEVNEASNSWKCEGKLKLMTRSGKRRNSTWPSLYGRM